MEYAVHVALPLSPPELCGVALRLPALRRGFQKRLSVQNNADTSDASDASASGNTLNQPHLDSRPLSGARIFPTRRHVLGGTLGFGFSAAYADDTRGFESGALAAATAVEGGTGVRLPLVPDGKEIAPGLVPSSIIKGCWQLAGGHHGDKGSDRTGGREAVDDFERFEEAGIHTFDTADIYGPSEKLIGEYLRKRGRTAAQVLTKYCVFSPTEMREPLRASVRSGIQRSMRNLGVDRLDLVQFFWSDYNQRNFVQTALYLAELQAEGLIRHIGVTNFDTPRLEAMMDSGVKVVSSQVQYSLLDRRAEVAHAQFCAANGVALLPFGVVGGGFLSDKYVGMPYEEAQKVLKLDTYSKSKYLSVLNMVGSWDGLQNLLSALKTIGDKYSTSVANVATKWVLSRRQVAAVIIGARNARHVADHQKLSMFDLDKEDEDRINEALEKLKQPKEDIYTWERGGAF